MGSDKVAQGFTIHLPIHSSFSFAFLLPFPIFFYPSLVRHPPVMAFNVPNPLLLPTHKSTLFSPRCIPALQMRYLQTPRLPPVTTLFSFAVKRELNGTFLSVVSEMGRGRARGRPKAAGRSSLGSSCISYLHGL